MKEAACAAHKLEEVDVQMWDYCFGKYYGDEPMDTKPDKVLGRDKLESVMLLEKVGRAPGLRCTCEHFPASYFSTPTTLLACVTRGANRAR